LAPSSRREPETWVRERKKTEEEEARSVQRRVELGPFNTRFRCNGVRRFRFYSD